MRSFLSSLHVFLFWNRAYLAHSKLVGDGTLKATAAKTHGPRPSVFGPALDSWAVETIGWTPCMGSGGGTVA